MVIKIGSNIVSEMGNLYSELRRSVTCSTVAKVKGAETTLICSQRFKNFVVEAKSKMCLIQEIVTRYLKVQFVQFYAYEVSPRDKISSEYVFYTVSSCQLVVVNFVIESFC